MKVLGSYSINLSTNQTYVSESILPLFCSIDANTPSLDSYFLNIISSERTEVRKIFYLQLKIY